MDVFYGFSQGGANVNMSNLTPRGKQEIIRIAGQNGIIGDVSSVNNITPNNLGNISISLDNIPDGPINKSVKNSLLDDISDVSIVNPQNNETLLLDTTNLQVVYRNTMLTTDLVAEGQNNKYFTDNKIDTYLKTILTTSQDILYRNENDVISNFQVGVNNTFLHSNNGLIEWTTINNTDSIGTLTDVLLTNTAFKQVLIYDNVNKNPPKWINVSLTTDYVSASPNDQGRQYYSDTKVNQNILNLIPNDQDLLFNNAGNLTALSPIANRFLKTTILNKLSYGQIVLSDISDIIILNPVQGDILYFSNTGWTNLVKGNLNQVLTATNTSIQWADQQTGASTLDGLTDVNLTAPITTGQILYKSATDWINRTITTTDIDEGTNEYYTPQKVDDKLNEKYIEKGNILIGTGIDAYMVQNPPINNFQLLVSDITNLLNPTGMSWQQIALNGSYFSNILINNLVDGDILSYNGVSWLNSDRLSTTNNNVATINTRVTNLEQQINTEIINPATTPFLTSYNQINAPVVRATFIANSAILPQNTLLQDGSLDPLYLTASNNLIDPAGFGYSLAVSGNITGTFQQVIRQLFVNGPTFAANTINGTNYSQQAGAGVCIRYHLNYVNNGGLPAGMYSCFACAGNFIPATNFRWFGLKNQALVTTEMTVRNVQPSVGADWDLIAGPIASIQGGIFVNVNTVNKYYMICISNSGVGRVGAIGYAQSQTSNENYQFGNQLTLNATSGNLVITKNTALQNAEQWVLNNANLSAYYMQSVVSKVIRALGLMHLNNSIFEDYRIRINNLFNSFSFLNALGTVTYLKVDTLANRVTIPNRFLSTFQKLDTATTYNTSVLINNTYYNVFLGDGLNLTITNNPLSTPTISYTATSDEITVNNAIGIKLAIEISASLFCDKNVAVVDVTTWDMSNNIEILAGHRRYRVDGNYYMNYDTKIIFAPQVASHRLSLKIKCSQGAVVTISLTNLNINISDTFIN